MQFYKTALCVILTTSSPKELGQAFGPGKAESPHLKVSKNVSSSTRLNEEGNSSSHINIVVFFTLLWDNNQIC